ncbi:hypothetical protein KIPB_002168 [Kipferlia bialata]|uniref:Uncharacterized protein n=1 Tax=Kipferlia bialata TaxID=797122 RepID=A0A9K3CQD4_9EUKA|nr:hypothetical protein KIPB_002168 [Kipferlia bialata]|eukprot:g2168.t1
MKGPISVRWHVLDWPDDMEEYYLGLTIPIGEGRVMVIMENGTRHHCRTIVLDPYVERNKGAEGERNKGAEGGRETVVWRATQMPRKRMKPDNDYVTGSCAGGVVVTYGLDRDWIDRCDTNCDSVTKCRHMSVFRLDERSWSRVPLKRGTLGPFTHYISQDGSRTSLPEGLKLVQQPLDIPLACAIDGEHAVLDRATRRMSLYDPDTETWTQDTRRCPYIPRDSCIATVTEPETVHLFWPQSSTHRHCTYTTRGGWVKEKGTPVFPSGVRCQAFGRNVVVFSSNGSHMYDGISGEWTKLQSANLVPHSYARHAIVNTNTALVIVSGQTRVGDGQEGERERGTDGITGHTLTVDEDLL